ncbi:MAG: hypothetical protein IJ634_04215 [Bacteroidales bacterium]|nr:hypothetical protein [Bacteroidales bacterium]
MSLAQSSSNRLATIVLVAVALLMASCSSSSGDGSPVVAKVYDLELHRSDIEGLVPAGLASEDSMTVVQNYVDQWIRQAVILTKARKNVENDFSRELQEYKNNLLVYAYERQIVDQLIDTTVTDSQIEEYYNAHKSEFLLKSSIVKAVYVTAPVKSPAVAKIKKIVLRGTFGDGDVLELEETASRNGFSGYYDASAWMPFVSLQTVIPVTAYNEQLFLRQHRTITLSDDSLFYAARILDYKVTDETSPIEIQRDNIRAIIVNHRKIDILNKLRSDLLAEAEKGGYVKRKL